MISRDFCVTSIDVTGVSLSLSISLSLCLYYYYSQKSLTHNIGSASALSILSYLETKITKFVVLKVVKIAA